MVDLGRRLCVSFPVSQDYDLWRRKEEEGGNGWRIVRARSFIRHLVACRGDRGERKQKERKKRRGRSGFLFARSPTRLLPLSSRLCPGGRKRERGKGNGGGSSAPRPVLLTWAVRLGRGKGG